MPLMPSNRPFDGCALLAVFSDARGSSIVDGVLSYDDWYRLSQWVEAARGQPLELTSTRVTAVFRNAAEGWKAAQSFVAEVERRRLADPVRRLLSVQLLLDWGPCTLVGKELQGEFVPGMARRLAKVPGHAIAGSSAFLRQLMAEKVAPPTESKALAARHQP